MRKFTLFLCIAFSLSFVSRINAEPAKKKVVVFQMLRNIIMEKPELMYLNAYVPIEFRHRFMYETFGWTEKEKIRVLAQAAVESNGWKTMVTPKNWDGSRDLGPLGLNSSNLKDPYFLKNYWPYESENNTKNMNVLYMAACIRFIHGIFNEFGVSKRELINYNAGYNCAIRDYVPSTTKDYIRRVYAQEKDIELFLDKAKIKGYTQIFSIESTTNKKDSMNIDYREETTKNIEWYDRKSTFIHSVSWIKIYNWWENFLPNSNKSNEEEIDPSGEISIVFTV